jgi:Immunity protein 53
MPSTFQRLAGWYQAQCDGVWEHSYGVKIDTLDNPGWTLNIDLAGTALAEVTFAEVKVGDSDSESTRWMTCRKKGVVFEAFCGPELLEDVLNVFLDWAELRTAG